MLRSWGKLFLLTVFDFFPDQSLRQLLKGIVVEILGGKSIYGVALGILMLETRFPRILGDMGHAGSWPFPVHYKIVPGASPRRVVCEGADGLLDAFIKAARELEREGVDGITTNCGFLSVFQEELSDAVSIPVATSSLLQLSLVRRILPKDQEAGLLTISGSTLTAEHLQAASAPMDIPIASTENGREFTRVILGNEEKIDIEAARQDNVEAACRLLKQHPQVGAIVLECTNMTPYAADIRAATQVPVYSMESFVTWFHSGLCPRRHL